MLLPEFLSADKFGYIHLTGHRVGLVDVLEFYQQGESAEMLSIRFPPFNLRYCIESLLTTWRIRTRLISIFVSIELL